MSSKKEPYLFWGVDYQEVLDECSSLFSRCENERYFGESSPIYSETIQFPEVPRRIYEYNTSAKIIYLVREPFSRLRSAFKQALSTGHWIEERLYSRYKNKMPLVYGDAVFSYPPLLDATKYWTHVQCYRHYFPDDSIKVVLFEDLIMDTAEAVKAICSFLDIDDRATFEFEIAEENRGAGKTVYNPWPGRIRKLIPEAVLGSMPEGVKNLARDSVKILPVPNIAPPVLCPEDEARVRDILAIEVEGIYRYLGIQDDPWNFFSHKTYDGEPS